MSNSLAVKDQMYDHIRLHIRESILKSNLEALVAPVTD